MAAPRKGVLSGLNLINHLGIGVKVTDRKVGIGLSVFVCPLDRSAPDQEGPGVLLNDLAGLDPAFVSVEGRVLLAGIAGKQSGVDRLELTAGDLILQGLRPDF